MGTAIALLVQHPYLVLCAWVAVEQLGTPLPSAPLMLAAGALSTSGRVDARLAIAAVVLGSVGADTLWYFLGRQFGHRVIRFICLISFEPATCVRKTEAALGKYGAKTLLIAKFIPGLNVVAAPIAGQSGVDFPRFLLLDGGGAFAWAATFVLLGRIFGEGVATIGLALVVKRFAAILFVLLVLGLLARRIVRHARFHKLAEAWRVTAVELKTRTDSGEAFHLIDLRPRSSDAEEDRTLPGAVRQSAAQVLARIDELPRDRDVVLFCGCPGERSAVALAVKLRRRGLERVHPLRAATS